MIETPRGTETTKIPEGIEIMIEIIEIIGKIGIGTEILTEIREGIKK